MTNRIESLLLSTARSSPEKTAVVDGAETITFAQLADASKGVAFELLDRGVAPGDRVGVFLDKTIGSIAAMFGGWMAGAIVVPMNTTLKQRQLHHLVTHSGAKVVISEAHRVERTGKEAFETTAIMEVPQPKASSASLPDLPGDVTPAAILYTSGSTGLPKGITLSHANLLAGERIVSKYLEIRADERILSVLPFSFDYGLNQLLTSVGRSATLVLQRSALAPDICRSLERHEITAMAGVPPIWIQLLDRTSPFAKMKFPALRYITNSGGALPVEIVKKYRELVPHTRVYLMYGLTEAFRSTYLPPDQTDRIPTSMGKAIPECEILVVGEGNRICGPGEVGELVHRGPTVALNYWRDPEATAARFKPNPFDDKVENVVYSGDLVKRDEDGFLFFVARADEMIKTLGYRVSPTEVEEVLYDSKLVTGAVVTGEPDPVAGKAVVAHVVPTDPATFKVEALLEVCRKELPAYMVPKRIQVHESFPRTSSGKIDRKQVKASLGE